MAKIEVKKVQATMTVDDRELHWEAVVCYGAYDVTIPLPAHDLIGDAPTQRRQSVEAIESLAKALLAFADQTRKRWPGDWGLAWLLALVARAGACRQRAHRRFFVELLPTAVSGAAPQRPRQQSASGFPHQVLVPESKNAR